MKKINLLISLLVLLLTFSCSVDGIVGNDEDQGYSESLQGFWSVDSSFWETDSSSYAWESFSFYNFIDDSVEIMHTHGSPWQLYNKVHYEIDNDTLIFDIDLEGGVFHLIENYPNQDIIVNEKWIYEFKNDSTLILYDWYDPNYRMTMDKDQ